MRGNWGFAPPTNLPWGDPFEVAWAGGLFEGEGSIIYAKAGRKRVDGSRRRSLKLQIGMTDLDVLQRFHRAVGLRGSIFGPGDRGKNKPIYTWAAGSRCAREVAQQLRPYLCERRLAKLEEVLDANL